MRVVELNPDLIEQARDIHTSLAKNPDFPRGYCYKAARMLERLGLKYVSGGFLTDLNEFGEPYPDLFNHGWAQDRNGIILELTGAQFNPYIREFIQDDVVVIFPKNPLRKRYIKGVFNYFITGVGIWKAAFFD